MRLQGRPISARLILGQTRAPRPGLVDLIGAQVVYAQGAHSSTGHHEFRFTRSKSCSSLRSTIDTCADPAVCIPRRVPRPRRPRSRIQCLPRLGRGSLRQRGLWRESMTTPAVQEILTACTARFLHHHSCGSHLLALIPDCNEPQ